MSQNHASQEQDRAAIGSATEEAARLVEALRRWVDDRGVSSPTVDVESTDCRLCPICQAINLFRQGQPEVFEHLGNAAESLLAAMRAGISAHEAHSSSPGQPDVEHIDID